MGICTTVPPNGFLPSGFNLPTPLLCQWNKCRALQPNTTSLSHQKFSLSMGSSGEINMCGRENQRRPKIKITEKKNLTNKYDIYLFLKSS